MTKWTDNLKRWLSGQQGKEKPAKNQKATVTRFVILALIGVALLMGSRFLTGSGGEPNAPGSSQVFSNQDAKQLSEIKSDLSKGSFSSLEKYETYVNQNLKNILEQIHGVSDVSVMVNVSSTGKKIYQNNVKTQDNQTVENDQRGGSREVNERNEESQVVMVDKDGMKEPVVIGEEQPDVRGVIVVASGAEQSTIKVEIMEAVATVLDIPTYKVKVLQKSESGG